MKEKGFTLAEVMGVIILLSIVALITIPSVEKYIKNSREKTYNATINEILKSARNWNDKYGNTVTWYNSLYILQLEELKWTEFLSDEDIVDPRTNTKMEGCIRISVSETDDYDYEYSEDNCEL